MSEQECRILLDTWGARTAASPIEGRKEADRILREVARLGNPPALKARALAISGSSFRATGKLDQAGEHFAQAAQIYLELGCRERQLCLDEGDLRRRMALLLYSKGQLELAVSQAREAVLLFQAADEPHLLGISLMAMGIAEIDLGETRALQTLSRACELVDPAVSMAEYVAAVHNLVFALATFEPTTERLEECLRTVCEMRLGARSRQPSRRGRQRQLVGKRLKTLPDAMARALLGRIHNLLGQHEEARRLLVTARVDLAELGAPAEQAGANIELAECLIWSASPKLWTRVGPLVDEALKLVHCFPRGEQELAAVEKLRSASATLSRRRLHEHLKVCRRLVLESSVAAAGHL